MSIRFVLLSFMIGIISILLYLYKPLWEPNRIVIIGAGFSGLSAAQEFLLRTSNTEIIVLEKKGRPGGRISSVYDVGGVMEIGATFIHGVKGNPVTLLAQHCHETIVPVDYDSILVYGPDNVVFAEDDFHRVKSEYYDAMRKLVMRNRDRLHKDIDLKSAFREAYLQIVKSNPALNLTNRGRDRDMLSWHFFWEIVQDQIAQLNQLSTIEYDASTAFDGDDYIVKNGMLSLPLCMEKEILASPRATIRYNTSVNRVDYEGGAVKVVMADGDVVEGDHVVVTAPLGVLQKNFIQFQPPLPRWKRRSLHRLGCAATLKIGLKFDKPFWPKNKQFFGKIGSNNTHCSSRDEVCYGDGNLIEFVNLDYFFSNGVLVAEVDGDYATVVVQDPQHHLMIELRSMFGQDVPDPITVRVHDYINDESIGGCGFSYWPPFTSGDDNLDVAAPVGNGKVHFAGEHTTPFYYANLHGALLEGKAVVARVQKEVSPANTVGTLISELWAMFSTLPSSKKKNQKKRFVPQWCPAPCQ